jgi:D-lactate dehydrogenase
MNINTGDLTHDIRQAELPRGSAGYVTGDWTAGHLSLVKNCLRPALTLVNIVHTIIGTKAMSYIAKAMHNILHLPLWTPAMPKSIYHISRTVCRAPQKVVYFPSCINQTMGLSKNSPEKQALVNEMIALLQKAGYEVIFPENMDNLCCGTIWESKGMPDIADRKSTELETALYKASEAGKYPVLCDQSPCLYRMRHSIKKMKLYEPVEFITTFLLDKLQFVQTGTPIAVHITCSMRKMGLDKQVVELAERCSSNVLIPEEVGCCGFAGDKGFTFPEVNVYALRKLRPQIEKAGISQGYSNSRTCEIGLTTNSGINYQSIVYLVNQHTK